MTLSEKQAHIFWKGKKMGFGGHTVFNTQLCWCIWKVYVDHNYMKRHEFPINRYLKLSVEIYSQATVGHSLF